MATRFRHILSHRTGNLIVLSSLKETLTQNQQPADSLSVRKYLANQASKKALRELLAQPAKTR